MQQKHPVIKQHIANCRTGFIEGIGIGQLVLRAESLNTMHRAKATGDVHARVGDVAPNAVERAGVGGVAGEHTDISHAAIQIRRAHGVADRFLLLRHRRMLLRVGWSHHTLALRHISDAADFQKLPRHVQVQLLAGHAIQAHQCQLHFLMARRLSDRLASVVFGVALKEDLVDMARIFLRHLQQLVLASRLIIRDRRFIHVPHVVQLVTVHHKLVRLVAHHVFLRAHAGGVRGIQIAVGLLRRGNDIHDAVKLRLQFRIIAQLGEIRRAFHHLVQVRVNEPMRSMALGALAGQLIRRRLQMLHARFRFLKRERHQHLALGLQPRPPKGAGHFHRVKRHGLKWIIGGFHKRNRHQEGQQAAMHQ